MVSLLHCNLMLMGSKHGSRLSACWGKNVYGSPSVDPTMAGTLCTRLSVLPYIDKVPGDSHKKKCPHTSLYRMPHSLCFLRLLETEASSRI